MSIKVLTILGMTVELIGFSLAWIWFGWKLAVIIALCIWGNNMEIGDRK